MKTKTFKILSVILLAFGPIFVCTSCGTFPLTGAMHFPSKSMNRSQVFQIAQVLLSAQIGWQVINSDINSGIIRATHRGSKETSWTINVGKWDEEGKKLAVIMTMTNPAPILSKQLMIDYAKLLAKSLKINEEDVRLEILDQNFIGMPTEKVSKLLSEYGAPEKESQPTAVPPSPPPSTPKPEPTSPEKSDRIYLFTIKNSNIRATPTTKSQILTTIKKGTKIEKISESRDWFKVKLPSGEIGHVFKPLVIEIQ